jgi:maltoporin
MNMNMSMSIKWSDIALAVTLYVTVACNVMAATDLSNKSTLNMNFSLRTSVGTTKDGETELSFKAPGAVTKYRLGNEADNNLKLALEYRRYLGTKKANDEKYVKTVFMLEGYDIQGNDKDSDLSKVAQSYISFNNFVAKGVHVWVGRRWYERTSTYMTDHFWLNTGQHAQAGAGIEGIKFGGADFNAAFIMSEDHAAKVLGSNNKPKESVNSSALDLRLKNIATNEGGKLNLWAYYSVRADNNEAALDDEDGFGLAAWHSQKVFDGKGKNTIHLMYRDGTAVSRSDFNPNPIMNNGTTLDTNYLEIATDLVTKVGNKWALGFTALYRNTEEVTATGVTETDVFSIGIRPHYALSEHFSAVFELGHDQVDNGDTNGGLTKFTAGLQLNTKHGYWERPAVRLFATLATWDDDFKGKVGGDVFADETFGWTVGIQGEWWWYGD